jgi:uncharacterized delta-60 repeat protein
MRSWFKNIRRLHRRAAASQGNPSGRRARVMAACLPVAESIEGRAYLSFAPSLSAIPSPILTTDTYTAYVDTAGSVSATQDVFHWSGTASTTVSSPTNPQAANHTYSTAGTYSPTAAVTPSGGSTLTVPLTLDSQFGQSPTYSGKTVAKSNGATGTNNGVGMYIDPSTHLIYVLATFNSGGTNEFAVTQFHANGSVDTTDSFGTSGTKLISFDSYNDTPAGIAYDPSNGDLIVVGTDHSGFCAAAISPANGALDTVNFTPTGELSGVTTGTCNGLVVQSDGKIVLFGNVSGDFLAFRVTSAGATDNGFGTNGKKTIAFSGPANAYAGVEASFIGSGPDDDIILGGSACEASGSAMDFGLAALNISDGSLDTNFNSTGKQTYNFCSAGSNQDTDYSLAVDTTNDRVVAGGVDTSSGTPSMAVVVLDNTGGVYKATTLSVGTSSTAYAVAVQSSDQKIVLAGTASGYFSGTSNDFAVVRLNSDTTADTTFGSSDKTATDFSTSSFNDGYDVAKALTVDSDGTIVAIGQTGSTSTGGNIALARYLPSNQLVVNSGMAAINAAAGVTPVASTDATGAGSGALLDDASDLTGRHGHLALLA